MSASWASGLHPALAPWFEALVAGAQRIDGTVRVTSGYRSITQQSLLYRRYLAGQASFPAAPPGRSYHNYGRAIDVIALSLIHI